MDDRPKFLRITRTFSLLREVKQGKAGIANHG
jgi:hypothetical protein